MITRSTCLLLAVASAAGCGPSNVADEADASSSGSSSAAAPVDTSSENGSTSLAFDTSTTADATTGEMDPCTSADPIDGCPNGCMDVVAYLGTGDDIDTSSTGLRMCIGRGDPLAADYRSAWWSDIGSERRFLVAGHGCGLQLHATPLEAWHECGTTPDEPAECGSLCAQDVCPGEQDAIALAACDVSTPCPAVQQMYLCEPTDALRCIHAALADRQSGRYELEFHFPNLWTAWTLVVATNGSVQVVSMRNDTNACHSAFNGLWMRSETCTLADPEFFTGCAEAMTWCGGDSDACQSESLGGWLTDCEPTVPECP
jgi:hypothetical protein